MSRNWLNDGKHLNKLASVTEYFHHLGGLDISMHKVTLLGDFKFVRKEK